MQQLKQTNTALAVTNNPAAQSQGSQRPTIMKPQSSSSQLSRPKTAGMLPPRQSRPPVLPQSTISGSQHHPKVEFVDDPIKHQAVSPMYMTKNMSMQNIQMAATIPAQKLPSNDFFTSTPPLQQMQSQPQLRMGAALSASSPQFSLNAVPISRRPVSAMRPTRIADGVNGENSVTPLPALASMKPTITPNQQLPQPQLRPIRGASAITRTDAGSHSTGSNLQWATAKSSNGAKSTKHGVRKGLKKKKEKGGAVSPSVSKKMHKTHKYVTRHIDNFVTAEAPRPPRLAGKRPRPGSAAAAPHREAVGPMTQPEEEQQLVALPEELKQPQQDYPQAPPFYEQLNQEIESDLRQQSTQDQKAAAAAEKFVYKVYNYYGGCNNHNYNSGANSYSNTAATGGTVQAGSAPLITPLESDPAILATNQPPMDTASGQPDLQNRKRMLMAPKIRKKPIVNVGLSATESSGKKQVMPRVSEQYRASGLPLRARSSEGIIDTFDSNKSIRSLSDHDMTLVNRSYLVDTDRMFRHLHRKSQNYDVLRGLGEAQVHLGQRPLSKMERQMYVLEYLENARTKNPFRALKMKDLMDKQRSGAGSRDRQELHRMIQQEQEEDWATEMAMAHSDDEVGGYVPRARRGDLGQYLSKDLNQFSHLLNRINSLKQYKKLQQLKATQKPYNSLSTLELQYKQNSVSKSKSKSASRNRHALSPTHAANSNTKTANVRTHVGGHLRASAPKQFKDGVQLKKFVTSDKRFSKHRHIVKKFIETDASRPKQQRSKSRHRLRQALKHSSKSGNGDIIDSPRTVGSASSAKRRRRGSRKNQLLAAIDGVNLTAKKGSVDRRRKRLKMSPSRIEEASQTHLDHSSEEFCTVDQSQRADDEYEEHDETPEPQHSVSKDDSFCEREHMIKYHEAQLAQLKRGKKKVKGLLKSRSQEDNQVSIKDHKLRIQSIKQQRTDIYQDNVQQHLIERQQKESIEQPKDSTRDDLHSIQQSQAREQMQTSTGQVDVVQKIDETSLMTETEVDLESKVQQISGSMADNTPKSASQQISFSKSITGVFGVNDQPQQSASKQDSRKVNSQQLDVVQEVSCSVKQKSRKMFDLGDPSEASGNYAAMLDFDMGLVSQHSSSVQGPSGDPQELQLHEKQKIDAYAVQETDAQINEQDCTSDRAKQEKKENEPLGGSRPPLLKMRTSVEARKKDLTKSIDGQNHHHGSVGGHVQSEQQNSTYQKAESSAKMTQKQTISVHQIRAENNGSASPVTASHHQQNVAGGSIAAQRKNQQIQQAEAPAVEGTVPSQQEYAAQESARQGQKPKPDLPKLQIPSQRLGSEQKMGEEHGADGSTELQQLASGTPPAMQKSLSPQADQLEKGSNDELSAPDKIEEGEKSDASFVEESLHSQQEILTPKQDSQQRLVDRFSEVQARMSERKKQRELSDQMERSPAKTQPQVEEVVKAPPVKLIDTRVLTEIGTQTLSTTNSASQTFQETVDKIQQEQEEIKAISIEQAIQIPLRPRVVQADTVQLPSIKEESTVADSPVSPITMINNRQLQQAILSLGTIQNSSKLIVRSPFEQEMIECLALAATKPKTQLEHPPTIATPRIMQPTPVTLEPIINQSVIYQKRRHTSQSLSNIRLLGQQQHQDNDLSVISTSPEKNQSLNFEELVQQSRIVSSRRKSEVQLRQRVREPAKGLIEQTQQKILNEGLISSEPGKKISQAEKETPIEIISLPKTAESENKAQDALVEPPTQSQFELKKIITEKMDEESESHVCQDSQRLTTQREQSMQSRLYSKTDIKKLKIEDIEYDLSDLILPEGQVKMNNMSDKTGQSDQESLLTESEKDSPSEIFATEDSPVKEQSVTESIKELERQTEKARRKSTIVQAQSQEQSLLAMNLQQSQESGVHRALTMAKGSSGETPVTGGFAVANSPLIPSSQKLLEEKYLGTLDSVIEEDYPDEKSQVATKEEIKRDSELQTRLHSQEQNSFCEELSMPQMAPQVSLMQPDNGKISELADKALKRATTNVYHTIKKVASAEKSMEAFYDEKQRRLARVVDQFVYASGQGFGDQHQQNLTIDERFSDKALQKIIPQALKWQDSEESYWHFERDEFDFEHLSFSIVTTEQMHQLEQKILNQITWNGRLLAKVRNRNMVRLETRRVKQPENKDTSSPLPMNRRFRRQSTQIVPGGLEKLGLGKRKSVPSTIKPKSRMLSTMSTVDDIQSNFLSRAALTIEESNSYEWLKVNFPMIKNDDYQQLKKLNRKITFVNVSDELADEISEVRHEAEFERQVSRSGTGTPLRKLNSSMNIGSSQPNPWLSISLHFSDMERIESYLKSAIGQTSGQNLFEGVEGVEEQFKWDEHAKVLDELLKKCRSKNNQDYLEKTDASLFVHPCNNEHIRKTELFSAVRKVTFAGLVKEEVMTLGLKDSYLGYLQHHMCDSGYESYKMHLWNVSQWTKNFYVNQGERALSFFDSSLKHSDTRLRGVVADSHLRMAIFLRRSTIRQEIQTTLFQRTTQLLSDEAYVSRKNRPMLLEKIRLIIQNLCQDDNAYQDHRRLVELGNLKKGGVCTKPKEYMQLSRMLIFINFHPPEEGKRWIHQDYMDSLKRLDRCDTPRFYNTSVGIDTQANRNSNYIAQQKSLLGIDDSRFSRQKSLSARETNRIVRRAQTEIEIVPEVEQDDKNKVKVVNKPPKADFPFKLNDLFGYCTQVINDGCYLILVPSKPKGPPSSKRSRRVSARLSGDNTPTAQIYTRFFNDLRVDDAQNTGRASHRGSRLVSGETSPMTFAEKVADKDGRDNKAQDLSQSFGLKKLPSETKLKRSLSNTEQKPPMSNTTSNYHSILKKKNYPKINVSSTLDQITKSTDRCFSTALVEGLAATTTKKESLLKKTEPNIKEERLAAPMDRISEKESAQSTPYGSSPICKVVKKPQTQALMLKKSHSFSSQGSGTPHGPRRIGMMEGLEESGSSGSFSTDSLSEDSRIDKPREQQTIPQSTLMRRSPTRMNFDSKALQNNLVSKIAKQPKFAMQRSIGKISIASSDNIRAPIKKNKESASSFGQSEDDDPSKALKQAKTNIATKQRREDALDMRKINNVHIMTISSMDQLKDTRMKAVQRRELRDKGILPSKSTAVLPAVPDGATSNTSMVTVSQTPTKLTRRKYAKNITVVRPAANLISNKKHDSKLFESDKFANPIMPKHEIEQIEEEESKHGKTSAAKLSSLLIKLKTLRSDLNESPLAINQQTNLENRRDSTNSRMGGIVGAKFLKTINNCTQVKVEEEEKPKESKFVKYKVQIPKDSQSMIRMKSKQKRIQEQKVYENNVEQVERNKVFYAIEFNQIQVVEAYIKSHMLASDVTDGDDNTLLSIAAQFGCYDICNLLIKEGANLNTQNKYGNTPLHYAIAYNMDAICDLLIESGADEHIKNKKRLTPWQGI